MSVLFVAVPVALLFASGALACFFWAVCRGQLDDLETPPLRMLQDDDAATGRKSCVSPQRPE
jgi:cbb3-type cytochrome oxidase maturation protein